VTVARAVLVRFAFIYWLLFCAALWLSDFQFIWKFLGPMHDALVQWVGHDVFGVSYEFSSAQTGSGDTTADWIWIACIAIIAVVASVAWGFFARRRAYDDRLRDITRVIVRYTLAGVLVGYGVSKLLVQQFPAPSGSRLLQQYGDSSPMGLMWTFMGASPAYVVFAGAGETLGAVLLWFRRTTTLGALVLTAVMTNVFVMNLCYDVPVKLNSGHYLAMCLYLLAPEARRLAGVVFDRAVAAPPPRALVLPRRWMRIARLVAKVGAIGYVTVTALKDRLPGPPSELDGTWNVTAFARDGKELPPLPSDGTRWSRLVIQSFRDKHYARWRFMNDKRGELYELGVDEAAHTMTFTLGGEQPRTHVLHYALGADGALALDGTIDGVLAIRLEHFDESKTLLMSRGFHWINEVPFNR
jgi:hypothetical protein